MSEFSSHRSIHNVEIDTIKYHAVLEGPIGPVAVLIHALMSNHHIWDTTVPALHQAGYRTLRFDHVGHNQSTNPTDSKISADGGLNFDRICAHIKHIIETVTDTDEPPAALIGCSIGGVLVLRYQMLFPSATTKIISCAAPGMTSLPVSRQKWLDRLQQWRTDGNSDELVVQTAHRWFLPPRPTDFDMQRVIEMLKRCSYDGYRITVWCTMNFDYTDDCDTVQHGQNIMILRGEMDANIGSEAVHLDIHRRIQGSKYVLMKDTGHIPPMHWPDRFNDIVLGFLQQQ